MDAQKKKYHELQTLLTEARDDIVKLEEENGRLKDQVSREKDEILILISYRSSRIANVCLSVQSVCLSDSNFSRLEISIFLAFLAQISILFLPSEHTL